MKVNRFFENIENKKVFYYVDGDNNEIIKKLKKFFDDAGNADEGLPVDLKNLIYSIKNSTNLKGILVSIEKRYGEPTFRHWRIKQSIDYENGKSSFKEIGFTFMGEIKLDENGDAYVDDLKVDTDKYNL